MSLATKIHSKLRKEMNYALNDMRSMLGINERLFQQTQGARIIIYHGICPADHTRFNAIFLQLKTFEKHLQFYKKNFNVISLDDYYNQRFSKDRFNVCISFDDGFSNNYKYVLPLINKYQVPATFFITGIRETGLDILWNDFLCLTQKYGPPELQFLNDQFYRDKHGRYVSHTSRKFLKDLLRETGFDKKMEMINLLEPRISFKNKMREKDYWLQMTEEEIKMLSASPLATIGCHSYYHNDLSMIPVEDARSEMIRSKQYLENITGKAIHAIAFPYGSYSRNVVAEAKSVGFSQLLAMDFLFQEDYIDPAMLERLTVNPYISVNNQMIVIINGKYKYN
jgi:peptidoglycan/xylan/chitin deacetylase (PgdA/CDA1 family)